MKIQGHIIAKIILITVLSLTFSIMLVMLKNISEINAIEQHTESFNMPTTNLFDRIDKWFALMSDDLYYKVKPMSDAEIYILSTMFCTILILLIDLLVGVGRSRTEERMERHKTEI
jgi:hypothetical protein